MEKYWYLFEAHGVQVLVQKGEDSDDNPAIQFVSHAKDGAEISFGLNFEPKEDGTIERSTAERDKIFATKEEELKDMAEGLAEKIAGCETGMDALAALYG